MILNSDVINVGENKTVNISCPRVKPLDDIKLWLVLDGLQVAELVLENTSNPDNKTYLVQATHTMSFTRSDEGKSLRVIAVWKERNFTSPGTILDLRCE